MLGLRILKSGGKVETCAHETGGVRQNGVFVPYPSGSVRGLDTAYTRGRRELDAVVIQGRDILEF